PRSGPASRWSRSTASPWARRARRRPPTPAPSAPMPSGSPRPSVAEPALGPVPAVALVGWFTDAFSPAFMQRALIAGLLAAAATAVVGTWVMLRGLTFLGDALAHGIVPGLALAT